MRSLRACSSLTSFRRHSANSICWAKDGTARCGDPGRCGCSASPGARLGWRGSSASEPRCRDSPSVSPQRSRLQSFGAFPAGGIRGSGSDRVGFPAPRCTTPTPASPNASRWPPAWVAFCARCTTWTQRSFPISRSMWSHARTCTCARRGCEHGWRSSNGSGSGHPRPACPTLIDDALALDPPDPRCVVHGDLHVGQTLVSGGELTGVIDWIDICRSDPAIDLVQMWTLGDHQARLAFRSAYGEIDRAAEIRSRVLALDLSGILALYGRHQGIPRLEREALAGLDRSCS